MEAPVEAPPKASPAMPHPRIGQRRCRNLGSQLRLPQRVSHTPSEVHPALRADCRHLFWNGSWITHVGKALASHSRSIFLGGLMNVRDLEVHTKIRDAEEEIDRLERMVTTFIVVTVPIAIATYSVIL